VAVLLVRLTPQFQRSRARLVKAGSSTALKLARVMRELGEEPVPAETDEIEQLPPVRTCWSRRIPGTAIAVLFNRIGDDVYLIGLRIWP